MAPITTTIDIDRSPQDAFAYATDPTRFVEWQHGVTSGHLEGEPPHKVGDHCVTTRRVGGAERPVTSELTHIDPPTAWGVRAIDGPVRAIVDLTVSPLDEGRRSRVKIDLDFTGHGIGRLLVPLFVRPGARKEMPENLARLKHRLEGR